MRVRFEEGASEAGGPASLFVPETLDGFDDGGGGEGGGGVGSGTVLF